MNTARKWISDVSESLKAYHLDSRLSNRFVLSVLQDKTRKFIRQDSDNRRLYRITELWLPLPELQFCAASLTGLDSLMKSAVKLPETYQTQYGNTLKLLTVDGEHELKQTTLHEYKELTRRRYVDPRVKYFFLVEGHVYVPASQVEELYGWGLFKHPHELKALRGETCLKPLDEPFPCPDYLEDVVKGETRLELLKTVGQVIQDERSDLNQNQRN